ncbi:uncharacterized protein PV09_05199 [Verruconis gallopava]|uniref:Uncharacterized protein n=1 Tax=Verruconis gallopava TaxID=253628 RepID=A0A0D2A9K5_9PEZI|nr:uncharacterized protein PV09_05199 [Verruconis gallopava]KIW03428.1 hypothetical protein PV09_05199 [Verruconis gallopava]
MSDWALAIALDSQRYYHENQRAQASTNAIRSQRGQRDIMRRLVVTLNTQNPPSRQLLTVVRCCQCGHRSGLPTDYSTPYQCLGYSGYYAAYTNNASQASDASSDGAANELSPQSTSSSSDEQRVACRHVYCLGCQWLVNGVFRTLHPIEIRDETDYSAYGYGQELSQQDDYQEQSSGGQRRGRGSRRSRN